MKSSLGGISRRQFIGRAVFAAAAASLLSFPVLARTRLRVWVVRAKDGVKYARADANHMRFKFYPSREAAMRRLPHRGMQYVMSEVSVGAPRGLDAAAMFDGRTDMDLRVGADRRHLAKLDFDLNQLERDLG